MHAPVFAFILFVLTSCDHWHEKYYYVENGLSRDVTVIYALQSDPDILFRADKSADTVLVGSGQIILIFDYGYVLGSVGVRDDRYSDPIDNIRIQINDTIYLISESKWTYERVEKYVARYILTVDTNLFNK